MSFYEVISRVSYYICNPMVKPWTPVFYVVSSFCSSLYGTNICCLCSYTVYGFISAGIKFMAGTYHAGLAAQAFRVGHFTSGQVY